VILAWLFLGENVKKGVVVGGQQGINNILVSDRYLGHCQVNYFLEATPRRE
jgi:hypothetical protein